MLVGGMVFWSPQIRSKLGLLAVVIGNASYSAYLASTLVIEYTYRGVSALVPPHSPLGLPLTLLYSLSITFAVLLVGWISYQFVEWPIVRRLQQLAR
jgi:peptidoglycan/LPS O-acetylase OafA/YrhL